MVGANGFDAKKKHHLWNTKVYMSFLNLKLRHRSRTSARRWLPSRTKWRRSAWSWPRTPFARRPSLKTRRLASFRAYETSFEFSSCKWFMNKSNTTVSALRRMRLRFEKLSHVSIYKQKSEKGRGEGTHYMAPSLAFEATCGWKIGYATNLSTLSVEKKKIFSPRSTNDTSNLDHFLMDWWRRHVSDDSL